MILNKTSLLLTTTFQGNHPKTKANPPIFSFYHLKTYWFISLSTRQTTGTEQILCQVQRHIVARQYATFSNTL